MSRHQRHRHQKKCWCGSADTDYAKHGESTGCTYECPGNPDETCGGFYAAEVYAYSTTTSYLGCFQDDRDRIMELALTDSSSMTKEVGVRKEKRKDEQAMRTRGFGRRHATHAAGWSRAQPIFPSGWLVLPWTGAHRKNNTWMKRDESRGQHDLNARQPRFSRFLPLRPNEGPFFLLAPFPARLVALSLSILQMCEAGCTGSTYFGLQYGQEVSERRNRVPACKMFPFSHPA